MARKKNKNRLLPYAITLCLLAAASLVGMYVLPALQAEDSAAQTSLTPGSSNAAEQSTTNEAPAAVKKSTVEVDETLAIPTLQSKRKQQIIEHLAYTVSYNPTWKIPNWVAYCLTIDELQGDCSREQGFSPDPEVKDDPVLHYDYSNSGYDRGHMAPAADFKWSKQAMHESFYTTNICPQNQNLNRGDWNDIEELVRDLARKHEAIYIACGPLVKNTKTTIGTDRKVVVPQGFFKVLLRKTKDAPGYATIGFYCPNEAGSKPIMTYAKSVDEIEKLTGIDFFPALPDSIEELVEKDFDFALWTVK